MYIADIQLSHPELVLTSTLTAVPEMRVELENQVIADAETYFLFFTVSDGDFAAFDSAVAADETVTESAVIVDGDDFRIYRMRLRTLDHLVLPQAAILGMHILHATGEDNGWRATLQVPEWGLFKEFRSFCASRDVDFSIRRLYEPDTGGGNQFGLTAPQRDILAVSYAAGYFKEPRESSLAEVAARLGISSSAASGRLRRALDALLAETVARDADVGREVEGNKTGNMPD